MAHADDFRERVEDALWVEYGTIARRADGSGSSTGFLGPGPHIPPTGLEAVAALEAIGLLDVVDASVWRERMLAPRPPLEMTPELRERLHVLLGRLVREALAGDRGDDAWFRPQTILNDLRALGLLDDEELHWWFSLLSPTPADAGDISGPREPLARLERFLRCVPGPAARRRGIRVLAVDIFEDGVCVHVHVARGGRAGDLGAAPLPDEVEPGASFARYEPGIELEDDLGTSYRGMSGGGGGGGSRYADGPIVQEHAQTFAGEVPAKATKLFVRLLDLTFTVGL